MIGINISRTKCSNEMVRRFGKGINLRRKTSGIYEKEWDIFTKNQHKGYCDCKERVCSEVMLWFCFSCWRWIKTPNFENIKGEDSQCQE